MLVAASVAVAGCGGDAATSSSRLANPASENCVATGGWLVIETAPGGQYGVCVFEDNRQCEEWALLRGANTRQQTASTPEAGTCTLPGASTCDALALYEGRCP